MKKVIITCALVCFCFVSQLSAQSKNDKAISYNIINEYGIFAGTTVGFEGVFINSIKFNKSNDLVGVGLGYSADINSMQGIPMFLNYRHYFDRGRIVQPLFNLAAGATYYFRNANDIIYYEDCFDCRFNDPGFGLYATIASGFRAKAFSLSAGFFVHSAPNSLNDVSGGLNLKVGFTF